MTEYTEYIRSRVRVDCDGCGFVSHDAPLPAPLGDPRCPAPTQAPLADRPRSIPPSRRTSVRHADQKVVNHVPARPHHP